LYAKPVTGQHVQHGNGNGERAIALHREADKHTDHGDLRDRKQDIALA
jgi:hypothetical protein